MKTTPVYILLLILLQLTPARAQYFNSGQDPASLKWKTIKSEHFNFIFPESYTKEALRAGSIYERAYGLIQGTLDDRPVKRFPVIMHNYSIESNGYVAWAPRRMELFPLPPQDNLPMDNHHQLALHELTHVIEIESLRKGITLPLSFLFGEQYTGATLIFVPDWYLEGNAVVNESVYSFSGRGRSPLFEKKMKALLVDGENRYSYNKMLNGSYRDYTPDHYQFGYQMSAYALANFSDSVWSKALSYTARYPFTLNPFNVSLRKNYNSTKRKLYNETLDYLSSAWKETDRSSTHTLFDTLNPANRSYTSYLSPVRIDENRVAAVKTTLDNIPRIVMVDPGKGSETVLHIPGYMYPARISYSSGLMTWAENRYDPRWQNRGYSVLMLMNLESGKISSLSKNSRYFSPTLSGDGKHVVAVESTVEYVNSLVVIEVETGKVTAKISLPGNILPEKPVWSGDDNKIVFIAYSNEGEGLSEYDLVTGTYRVILEPGNDDLESVAVTGDTILYTSSVSGTDNIYAIVNRGMPGQVFNSRFGVSDISWAAGALLFSDYSISGNNIGRIGPGDLLKEPYTEKRQEPLLIGKIDTEVKLGGETGIDSSLIVQPYQKWKHLFNFHSWMPFWSDINEISFDNLSVSPGVTLMSQNLLSTLTTTLGYEYSNGEHLLHSRLSWKGWYPAIDLDVTGGGTPAIIREDANTPDPSVIYTGLYASASVYLPLNFNHGRFNQTLWPYFRLTYNNSYVYSADESTYDYGQVLASSRLYFSNLRRMSYRDIWPRFGQVIDLNNVFSPGDGSLYGPVTSIRTQFYFPGLALNHSFRITLQAEKKEFRKLLINNRITLPRGYINIIPEKVSAISFDYAMPLAYPDLSLGSLLYIPRIRTTLFYDYARGIENYYYQKQEMVHGAELFTSIGTELLADLYILRIPFRISTGIQAAWLPALNKPYFNLLMNIDVFGFSINNRKQAQPPQIR